MNDYHGSVEAKTIINCTDVPSVFRLMPSVMVQTSIAVIIIVILRDDLL